MPDSGQISSVHQHMSASTDASVSGNVGIEHDPMPRGLNVSSFNSNSEVNDQNNNSHNDGGDSQNRREYFEEIRNGGGHWSHLLRQVVLTPPASDNRLTKEDCNADGTVPLTVIPLQILGGSENGQFTYVGHLNNDINSWISVGYLQTGDVILEIQKQQVGRLFL